MQNKEEWEKKNTKILIYFDNLPILVWMLIDKLIMFIPFSHEMTYTSPDQLYGILDWGSKRKKEKKEENLTLQFKNDLNIFSICDYKY